MKIAYFDCFSGIAGDMALAALLDCGVPLDELKRGLASLPVEGWDIAAEDVLRSGIHAKSVSILEHGVTDDEELAAAEHAKQHAHEHHSHSDEAHSHDEHDHHGEAHEHPHSHEEAHSHDHPHSHGDEAHSHDHHEHGALHHEHAAHHHGRSMGEIRALIEGSELGAKVQKNALAIFEKIAVAEAYLHHSTPDEVHFHEIGGLDSLLDIVGVAWCLDYLGIEKIYASALPLSSGFVKCAHGLMPVPAPATLEILKGAPWTPTEIRGELVTPTGAGILAALCESFGSSPALTIEKIGLGAGKKEFADRPNLLRVSIGEAIGQNADSKTDSGLEWATLTLLETNIDDMNPQLFEAVFEALFEAGALDVWSAPIAMKKNRAAQMLSVLCLPSAQNAVLGAILRQTTTLGVRVQSIERAALPRKFETVETKFGALQLKIADWPQGDLRRAHPEWEDVKRLARENGVPAREVFEAALRAGE